MESPSPAGGGERYREHNVIRLESILVQLGGILNSGLFSMHAQSVVVVDNDDDDAIVLCSTLQHIGNQIL